MDPFIGEVRIFAGTFAPQNWAFCNGQLLNVAQNQALFSILGTTYGGNGSTTFALPNLQGRCVLHNGSRPGGSSYTLGQMGGSETVTLTTNNLPAHTHPFAQNIADVLANKPGLAGGIPAQVQSNNTGLPSATHEAATGTFASQNTGLTGAGAPASTLTPYLVLNYIIALVGIYPVRS